MLSYDKSPAASHGVARLSPSSGKTQRNYPTMSQPGRHVFVVAGPAGSGKTTLAEFLAMHFGFCYLEGDNYHPPENIEKMSKGQPLQDADRWDWLINVREAAIDALEAGATGVVLTCSALKRKYRDVIRIASVNEHGINVHFLCLTADREILINRLTSRSGHFMGASMIDSQLRDLEAIGSKERDVVTIDVNGTVAENQNLAIQAVLNMVDPSEIQD